MALKITNLSSGNIMLIEPKGSLIGGDETDAIKNTITKLLQDGNKKLIIDLGSVDYLNSTALGVLVSGHTSYSKSGGKIKLCNVNKNIQNIFVITKLTLVFDVFESQKEAIASFAV
jgi:anti-sigma B factor antagonist